MGTGRVTTPPWTVIVAVLAAATPALAEDDDDATPLGEVTDIQQLSLADLLDTQVNVASKKPQTTRETPGIVTVITRDDIVSSGARELLEVLTLVPGFAPGVDVEGVIGLGIRGQWGHEGKILLLIDGQPMNELLYTSLAFLNHYPIDAIDHIEVIRGPGSAIYGGYAELAVINIVMRDAASLEGVAVSGLYGQLGRGFGHASATLSFGTTSIGIAGLSVTGSLMLGQATSEGTYRDFAGGSYELRGSSATEPRFLRLTARYRGLRADAIVDGYAMHTGDGYGEVDAVTSRIGFTTYALDLGYQRAIGEHLTITPRVGLLRQTPWTVTEPDAAVFYHKTITRYSAGLAVSYEPVPELDVLVGAEADADRAHVDDPRLIGSQTLFAGKSDIAYQTVATYAQLLVTHPIANLTLGARYEHQSTVGGALVPRIALTKVVGRFHAKLLASQAFRAPSVENINLSRGDLVPERTTVFEAEAGYELGEHMFVAANAFDVTIHQPITYEYDQATNTEVYQNSARSGTRGVELDYRLQYARGSAHVTYSYYTAAGKNAADAYRVPGHDEVLLAFPAHKVTMTGSVPVTHGLSFHPSAVIYGERYGYLTGDADGQPVLGRAPATALVNLYLRYHDALLPGLDVGAGVFDVADQHPAYLQPYNGGHAPMPSSGRELVVRVAYEHKL